MKVLVQNSISNLYFGGNSWVAERNQAMNFVTSLEAFDFCLQNHYTNVKVLLTFDNPESDIALFAIEDGPAKTKPVKRPAKGKARASA